MDRELALKIAERLGLNPDQIYRDQFRIEPSEIMGYWEVKWTGHQQMSHDELKELLA